MSTKSFEKGMTWTGIAIASVAALAFALVSAAAAPAADSAPSDTAPQKQTKMQLAVDRDGTLERVTLVDLHSMAVGETRALETESGRPVTVTRDENGFDVDIDGKTVRVQDRFNEIPDGDGNVRFEKRIMIGDGEEGEGGAQTMVLHGGGEPGDVVVMKRRSPEGDGHGFAFVTDGAELPEIPFGLEGTIARLEKNAKFLELDAATRAKVLEALRESTPQVQMLRRSPGEAGTRVMVISTDEDDAPSE